MIEVNLLPGPKKKKAGGGAPSISFDDFKVILAKVKDPLLVGAVGAWAVGIAVIAILYTADTARMVALDEDLRRVEAEQRRFSALITQKRRAEQLRDSLVVELNAIRGIDAERYIWPHIMEEVTRALPDYTWLVSVDPLAAAAEAAPAPGEAPPPPQTRIQIDGRTSDIQAYTRFLRQLANSPWMASVVAGPTNTVIEQDRPVTAFSLTASFRSADSAYIRTSPVSESLR
jgi:Tfp pilus assembly protein PilN